MLQIAYKGLLAFILMLTPLVTLALPNLGLGPFGPGVQDGSEPFNTCASPTDTAPPGDDCGEHNNQVRNQDTVVFNWSITANNYTPGQANPKNIILEQILKPSTNAVVDFSRIPARCTTAAGGGTTPPSSMTTEANGDLKLTCNLGEFNEGQQVSFSIVVKILGESWHGSTFTSSQRLYSNADDGTANAVPAMTADIGPITISARPTLDLSSGPFVGYYLYGQKDMGSGLGLEDGYWTWINTRFASARKSGTEAVVTPLTYTMDLSATKLAANGVDYTNSGFEYLMHDCFYNRYSWHGGIYGNEVYGASNLSTYPLNKKVVDSGICTFNRDVPSNLSSPYHMTITDPDLSGRRFPTQTIAGADLSAGPYYYVDMVARFFIPMRVIDNADGVIDGTGSIYIKNIFKDFDPKGVSGVLNYDGLKEPGHDGDPMPDGTISNNIAPAYNYYLTTRGTFADYAFKSNNDAGTSYPYFVSGSSHSGQGLLAPSQAYPNTLHFGNNGSNPLAHPRTCLAFDNSTQKLTDRSNTGGTAGTYAYVGTYAGAGFDHTNYIVEYGNVDLTGDDPLANGYNNQTGRYEGDWSIQGNVRCDDNITTWKTDPTQVGTGIDDVNVVRVRLKDSVKDTVKLTSSQYIRFITPLQTRQTFYNGPNNGQMVPVGTVLAGFGSVRSDEYSSAWTPAVGSRPYKPAPETGNTDGDRVTLARTTSFLDSESLLPVATPSQTNTTIAGKQIVWKINTSIQSLLLIPGDEENVHIIDELPPTVSYNKNCTINYTDGSGTVIGTPADLVKYNTDRNGIAKAGYTQLIWNLGTVTANDAIAPRVICTDSDALAPNGTDVVNYAEIRGDTLISALSQRSDEHTITLEQIGSIQVAKTVDLTLDDVNDDQVHTLSWANFAPSFGIDEPTLIDVLPFNGDNGVNSSRTPASQFEGKLALTGAPSVTWIGGGVDGAPLGTWYYSTDNPAGITHDPDQNSLQNTTTWVTEAALGGNFASVTALKFVSNYRLEKDGDPHQGMKATYTLQAGDTADPNSADANKPGNLYTNIFALDTDSLPAEQFLISNPVSVTVASYSVGDLVFADVNGNLTYDKGIDIPAPNGTTVNLYKASDNSLVATTTLGSAGQAGRYVFSDIGSGNYYVTIPNTEFQLGAPLEGWNITVTVAGVDDDKNDDTDQDGYTTGTVLANGVRTHTFELSAIAPAPGEVPKGNEPLGDNTGQITDTTSDDFSNLTLDIALVPILDFGDAPNSYGDAGHLVPVTPNVYLGALAPDKEAQPQHSANGGEDGIGDDNNKLHDEDSIQLMTPINTTDTRIQVNVSAHNTSTNDALLIAWLDLNNNGTFETNEAATKTVEANKGGTISLAWENIPVGTLQTGTLWMRIRLSTDSELGADNATGSLLDGEVEDYAVPVGDDVIVSGHVFNDHNVSTGIKEATDEGIANVTVVLGDAANNCRSVKTDASGYYQFNAVVAGVYQLYEAANEAVPIPKVCPAVEKDPTAYRSTTANTRTITVATTPITAQDFGDVLLPRFSPNNASTVLAGNVVLYPHKLTAQSSGTVNFTKTATGGVTAGWSTIIYQDVNCDGQLNNSEVVPLPANIVANKSDIICLINKVYAPNGISAEETYRNVIQADFDYGNALAGNVVLNVTDTTKTSANGTAKGSSRLELRKTVKNITQNTAETDRRNQAKLNDILEYNIYYSNTGTGVITDLVINDVIPEFTRLNGTPTCQTPLPVNLTACSANVIGDDIEWIFGATDVLKGGAKGSVSYRVTIE